MASARQIDPAESVGQILPPESGRLLLLAGVIAALCCGMAFLYFLLRDRGHPAVMVNEQSAPSAAKKSGTAAQSSLAEHGQTGGAPGASTEARNPFTLSRSVRAFSVGPLRLRLAKTDPASATYDVRVIAGRRSYSHKHIKVHEPLWIVVSRSGGAIQLVANSIDDNTVTGYWQESERTPQVSVRSRSRRR